MSFIFFLFLLLPDIFLTCPLNSIESSPNSNRCYYFEFPEQDYFTAKRACEEYGGHLASICNAFENTALAIEAKNRFEKYGIKDFWIGYNDMFETGAWNWSNPNAKCNYVDWLSGNPGSYYCATISVSGGKWQSVDCSTPKPFVCEQPAQKTPQCKNGYRYYSTSNACYKIFNQSATNFYAAEANCVKDGGHLVTIHSEEENNYIDDLIHETASWNSIWIGLYAPVGNCDLTQTKCWSWKDSTPITYTDWRVDYPMPIKDNPCSTMFSSDTQFNNGKTFWENYHNCSITPMNYICQQNPVCL